ncbi:MAG: hypothetical protein OEQ24_11585 [Gammaproteobacteria bacterium]|nr:hypothetical protein [Gammaproteobacteria bacterium]
MSFNLSIVNWVPFKQRTKRSATDTFTPKGYTSIAYTRDTATAALACAEAISHSGLDRTLIDDLLISGIINGLDHEKDTSKNIESTQKFAQQLLPKAKESLLRFYEKSKTENSDFEDIVNSANAECDIEFLKLVTRIFTKEFVKQTNVSNQ